MADGVAITAGSGTTIATDDCGAPGHAQIVKLAIATDGSATAIPSDATDGLLVNLGANNDVTVTSGTVTANLSAGTNTNEVVGDVAHDAAIAGNPVTIGGRASAAAPADVSADDDAVRAWMLRNGATCVQLTAAGTLIASGNGTAATAARVTIASDSTGQIAVASIAAGTNNIGDVDVLTLPALPAGTNNIGDVDVLTLPALPAGTNNIGDVDILTIAAGDNNIGNVDIVTMPNVTLAAGTNTNEVVGDAAHDAAAAGNPLLIGGYASAAAPADVSADADAVRSWMLRNGATCVQLTAAGALIAGDATNGIDVDVTRLPALVAGTANIGDVDVLTLPALPAGTNNIGDVDILTIAAGDNNIGNVDIVTMPNVTLAAGTNTNEVVGDAAHDAAAAGNPVLVCGVAQTTDDTAPPNRVSAESDATRIATDLDGSIFVRPHGPQVWSYHENSSSALTDTSVHAAPGAGLSLYVTDIVVSTGAATALNVFFEEGASTVLGPYYLEAVAGRGLHIKFGTPKKITANTALTVTTSAAIAHSIDVTGFTAPA